MMIVDRIKSRWAALAAGGHDKGAAITAVVVVLTLAGLFMLGLIVDGGSYVRDLTRADRVASEAARAGLDYYRSTGVPDPQGAVTAAENYIEAADTDGSLSGTATVDSTNHLEVTVTVNSPTVFLGLVGRHQLVGTGQGAADLVNTVHGG